MRFCCSSSCSRSRAELPRFWISRNRRPLESDRAIIPRPDLLARLIGAPAAAGALMLEQEALSFGGVHAIEDLDLESGRVKCMD